MKVMDYISYLFVSGELDDLRSEDELTMEETDQDPGSCLDDSMKDELFLSEDLMDSDN